MKPKKATGDNEDGDGDDNDLDDVAMAEGNRGDGSDHGGDDGELDPPTHKMASMSLAARVKQKFGETATGAAAAAAATVSLSDMP